MTLVAWAYYNVTLCDESLHGWASEDCTQWIVGRYRQTFLSLLYQYNVTLNATGECDPWSIDVSFIHFPPPVPPPSAPPPLLPTADCACATPHTDPPPSAAQLHSFLSLLGPLLASSTCSAHRPRCSVGMISNALRAGWLRSSHLAPVVGPEANDVCSSLVSRVCSCAVPCDVHSPLSLASAELLPNNSITLAFSEPIVRLEPSTLLGEDGLLVSTDATLSTAPVAAAHHVTANVREWDGAWDSDDAAKVEISSVSALGLRARVDLHLDPAPSHGYNPA